MKRKITSLCVAVCIIFTCFLPVQISASSVFSENAQNSYDVLGTVEGAIQTNNVMWFVNSDAPVAGIGELGGKTSYTTLTTKPEGEQFLNLRVQKANIDKTYIVSSFNVYGNVTNIIPKIRFGGSGSKQQPIVESTITTSELTANVWNSVKLVYNTTTREAYVLVNDKKIRATTFDSEITDTTEEYIDFRMVFSNNKTINFADIKAYKSNIANIDATLVGTIDYNKQEIKNVFWFVNGPEVGASTSSIGGKSAGDLHTVVTTPNTDTFINFRATNHVSDTDRKYIVTSANFFGNKNNLYFRVRYAAGQMNIFIANAGEYLLADRWNNIKFVYNRADKQAYLLINGKNPGKYLDYSNTSQYIESQYFDCEAYLNYKNADTSQVPDFRIIFDKSKTYNIDDIEVYKTDIEPTAEYKRLSGEKGDAGNSVVILSGTADFTAQGGNMKSADLINWSEATDVAAGEYVVVENSFTDISGITIGKTYNYVKVMSKSYSDVLATQSTMSYTQGGSPCDSEGNLVTDARIIKENVIGSGKTMELVAAGTNNKKSLQSYYSYNWNKKNGIRPVYLVAKFNFAYPENTDTLTAASGIFISTNGGKIIGNSFGKLPELNGKVNEYVWIYDTYSGTYNIYINDKIYFENQKADESFVSGDATAIRLTVSAAATTDGGTSENLVGMYMSDIEIIECNTAPVIGGTVTDSISWKYDEATETLYLDGSGVLPDYTQETLSQRPWHTYSNSIENLVVEEGITRIGSYVMANTTQLKTVAFPTTLKAIGNYTFADTAIESINLNNGLTRMGTGAFASTAITTSTKKMLIPSSVTAIGADAIKNRSGVVIECCADSYAHSWALQNNLEHTLTDTAYYITYFVKNAVATVYNFTDSSIVADVVFANYKDGELKDISIVRRTTINSGKTYVEAVDFQQPNGTVTKVMLMNSVDKLIPVCKASVTKVMPTIRIAGDSISAEWSPTRYGQQGWGKAIQDLWNDDITVINDAVSGWTTEMYYTQKWQGIKEQLREGDYLIVSYLHNDYYVPIKDPSKADYIETYKDYLQKLIDETKAMGVNIVLVVPPNRGVAQNFHGDFSFVMPELAEKNNVPLIDVHAKTLEMLIADTEGTKKLIYMYKLVEQGIITQQQLETHSNLTFRNSGEDLTHISTQGAQWVANYVADNLVTLIPELSQYRK